MTHMEALKNNWARELSSGRATFRKLVLKTLQHWVRPMWCPAEISEDNGGFLKRTDRSSGWKGPGANRLSSRYSLGTPPSPSPQGLSTLSPCVRHARPASSTQYPLPVLRSLVRRNFLLDTLSNSLKSVSEALSLCPHWL